MGKWVKITLSTIVAIVLLIVIVIFSLPFFIDANDFKPEITAAVKEKTGRDLVLTGDLKLSVFPWLGISTGKMALGNATGFQDQSFATLEESIIKFRLLPLITKRVEVSRIVLKGLTLNLAKDQQGVANWNDIITWDVTKASPPSVNHMDIPEETKALAVLAIGGITIENAQIKWDDQQSGKHLLIKDVNLNTDKFSYGKPVTVDLSLLVLKPETKFTESIKLTTDVTVNEKLDSFVLNNSALQTTLEGDNIPGKALTIALTAVDVSLDTAKQTVKGSGLQLKSNDAILSADITVNRIKDNLSFQGPFIVEPFSPAKVMKQMGIAVPDMQDANALSKLAANFNLSATNDSVDIQNLAMTLDNTQIKGSASFKDFALPFITFDLAADAIEVDRYLPPTAGKSSKPITSPAVALAVGASHLPVETLRKLNIDGQLSLGKLKMNGLSMQDIQLNLNAKNGIVKTQQSAKEFYQGSYTGNLSVDRRNKTPALALNEKISHVQVEPFLKDIKGEARMIGALDASAKLQGRGNNATEIKSSLTGSLSFLFKDSVVKGFNLQKMIDHAKSLIKETALPVNSNNDQTLFSEIKGTANITNGLIQNNDLIAISSRIHINGKGSVDLNTEKLDYQLTAKLIKAEATATEPAQVHDTPVNISVAGTVSKPTYSLDLAALLTDINKAKVEKFIDKNQEKIDKIADKIDKKLGSGVGDLLKGLFKKHKDK